ATAKPRFRHPLECKYLGERVGSTQLERKPGCGGCTQTEASVFECEQNGLAAPLAQNIVVDPEITDCRNCNLYDDAG
ncbi:MAG: hypothetical protein AAF961_01630, partial [Planctomycetota bacterium]